VTVIEPKDTDDVSGAARAAEQPASQDPAEDEDEPSGAREEEAPSDESRFEPAPDRVQELAAGCVRFIATRYGALLDFSPDTLSFVDQWVRDAREELGRRAEVGEVVQAAAGAYLGEVIRREFGGAWALSDDLTEWRLCLATVYCAFNPVGMVREALRLEPAEGWHAHFELDPAEREAIEQRLAALPEVEDDEFFAPSTRFDVVSILVDALLARMEAQGLANVRFTPDDYR
jgi:hypothetical protein